VTTENGERLKRRSIVVACRSYAAISAFEFMIASPSLSPVRPAVCPGAEAHSGPPGPIRHVESPPLSPGDRTAGVRLILFAILGSTKADATLVGSQEPADLGACGQPHPASVSCHLGPREFLRNGRVGSRSVPNDDASARKRRDPPWQAQQDLPNLRFRQRASPCGGSQGVRVMSPLLQPAESLAPRRPGPAYALARGPHRTRCRGEPTPTREWRGRDAGTPPRRSPRMRGSRRGGARSA